MNVGRKGIMILGTLVIAAVVVSAGFLGGWFLQSTTTINVETLGDTVTINGTAIPITESKVYNVAAGDTWGEVYTIDNAFSKAVTVYIDSTFTEPSLTVSFECDNLPVTVVTVPSMESKTIWVNFTVDLLSDADTIEGVISFLNEAP